MEIIVLGNMRQQKSLFTTKSLFWRIREIHKIVDCLIQPSCQIATKHRVI